MYVQYDWAALQGTKPIGQTRRKFSIKASWGKKPLLGDPK